MLCLQGDNPLGANACVNRALARVAREKWTHPPSDLYVLNQAVMSALSKPVDPAAKSPLPAWSFPPQVVVERPAETKPAAK